MAIATPAPETDHRPPCVVCGESMVGKRRHALTCSPPCRAERSRLLRILSGAEADRRLSLADHLARHRKRT